MTTGAGNDIVLGGHLGDSVNVGGGNNIVLGDDGFITWTGASFGGTSAGDDTDASDIEVVVEGRLGADGVFHATDVLAKCGSRYEATPEAPPAA